MNARGESLTLPAQETVEVLIAQRSDWHRRQRFMHEDKIGGIAADIGTRRGRHRSMGGDKSWRIIEPVAHHQRLAS